MKAVLIDNSYSEIEELLEYLKEKKWEVDFKCYNGTPDEEKEIVESILKAEQELVVLDVAYTQEEEENITGVDKPENFRLFSGFKLLQKIKNAKPSTVVFLFSKSPSSVLGIAANEHNVAGTLAKDKLKEAADLLYSIARNKLLCNLNFHDAINESVLDDKVGVKDAFDGFFLRTTPAHRFANLCMSLKPIVMAIMPDKASLLDNLWRRLEDTHKLLSLVDRGARDHVKHTGNVFWIGYHLLQTTPYYRDKDPDLLLGWVIASLFHDWAYADQKSPKVGELLKRVYPKAEIDYSSLSGADINSALEVLKLHAAQVESADSKAVKALSWMIDNWEKPIKLDYDPSGPPKVVKDHGILGAAHLLAMTNDGILEERKQLFLQAVLAIALHNLADWKRCWTKAGIPADVEVPFDKFPLCGLLALADNIQTWEREHENPLDAISNPDLRDLAQAYVRAGEIVEFELKRPRRSNGKCVLTTATRYSVTHGQLAKEACDELYNAVTKWDKQGHLKSVLDIFQLKNKFRIKLKYQIPFKDQIEIDSEL